MEKFWQWLMKADARGIFVCSVLAFVAVFAWRALEILNHAERPSAVDVEDGSSTFAAKAAKLTPYTPIGVIGLVSNQFDAGTLIVPVNPFFPTFESIMRNVVSQGGTNSVFILSRSGSRIAASTGSGAIDGPSEQGTSARNDGGLTVVKPRPGGQGRKNGATEQFPPGDATPYVRFGGMLQRPDGSRAIYVVASNAKGGGSFVSKGDSFLGAKVVKTTANEVEFEFPNGKTIRLNDSQPQFVRFTDEKDVE